MMNDGMKIILERMKTHPEEFADSDNPFAYDSKWTRLIHQYEKNLPKEDMELFKEAIDEMRQAEFTAKVMEELLDPKPEEQLTLNPYSVTLGAGATQGVTLNSGAVTGTITPTLTDSNLHQLLHMKAQMELEKAKAKEKQHKTLFGKLFNYL
jgi:hypothetical protein